MSTGRRLAKRSIIGTRVCALGADELWHSGFITAVKTPDNSRDNNNCINLTPNTKYTVRFDLKEDMAGLMSMDTGIAGGTLTPRSEFFGVELIGPGFKSVMDVVLRPGQRVFLTYNGRESTGEVLLHEPKNDEVTVRIPATGQEASIELKKRLEEVRLLESRRSARLADQDTDFARLADMAGDRRRASHNIDIFQHFAARKRRSSFIQDGEDDMDACNAAVALMTLSCSPHSPHQQWSTVGMCGSSPASSSASWCSGSSSPPLSDEGGNQNSNSASDSPTRIRTTSLSTSDEGIVMDYNEEHKDITRKRRANTIIYQCTFPGCHLKETTEQQIEKHVRIAHLGPRKSDVDDDGLSDHEEEFYYTEYEVEDSPNPPSPPTLSHRDMARPPYEDPDYQREIVGNFRHLLSQTPVKPPLPAPINTSTVVTAAGPINIPQSPLAHHNYSWAQQSPMSPQKHIRLSPRPSTSYAPYTYSNALAVAQHNVHRVLGTGPIAPIPSHQIQNHHQLANTHLSNNNINHHQANSVLNLSHSAPTTTVPNFRQNIMSMNATNNNINSIAGGSTSKLSPLSPNRRARGENKKCRKVYGMENRNAWCTQCKWKKACSRFGD